MNESYDPKSGELAEYFLSDEISATEEDRQNLAREIQRAAEDWLRAWRSF